MCSRCSCCQQAQESVSHLFLHGAVARGVWEHFFKVFGHLPFNASGVAAMLSYWFSSHSKVSATHVRVLVPLLVLWFIWKSRNFARFKVGSVTQAQVTFQIQEFLCQMSKARAFSKTFFARDRDCPWAHLSGRNRRVKGVALFSWEKASTGLVQA